ncbi:hypothetical protein HF1_09190 [Mycoplasma haemofelis str. Langford 1]|uniref:Lipoprotein n=1 Tax=Mycoplasma haemofelis (strain Langford 1) TaxID=941640 RepID=E8ZIF6_MYCHL|nr:hypothetical protein [Mycoplasma haemofelis]CBY92927.1 hypothetical protein HF1_09190 [Mycoplasma haemofelis str. Langford 1]
MSAKLPMMAGVAGLSSCAAGLGIYLNSDNRDTVSSLLEKEPAHVLLSSEDGDSLWNEAWKKYRDSNKDKELDSWKIKNFSANSKSETAIEGLKEACTSRYEDKVDGVKDFRYVNVKSWCTRPKKIFELLAAEKGIILLSKEASNSKAWSDAWADYKKEQNGTDTWKLSNWSSEKGKSEAPDSFKEKCKTQSEMNVNKGKEDELYVQVKRWCTILIKKT